MSECAQCRERNEKAAKCCESRFEQLQAKYQKLSLTFAVVSGVVGKEVVDKAMSLFDSVAPVVPAIAPLDDLSSAASSGSYTQPLPPDDINWFASVPPLTPRLAPNTESPDLDFWKDETEDYVTVPEIGMLPLLGLLPIIGYSKRKRDE